MFFSEHLKSKEKASPEAVCMSHKTKKGIESRTHLIVIVTVSTTLFELMVGPSRAQLQGHLTDVHHERRSNTIFFFLFCKEHVAVQNVCGMSNLHLLVLTQLPFQKNGKQGLNNWE